MALSVCVCAREHMKPCIREFWVEALRVGIFSHHEALPEDESHEVDCPVPFIVSNSSRGCLRAKLSLCPSKHLPGAKPSEES